MMLRVPMNLDVFRCCLDQSLLNMMLRIPMDAYGTLPFVLLHGFGPKTLRLQREKIPNTLCFLMEKRDDCSKPYF